MCSFLLKDRLFHDTIIQMICMEHKVIRRSQEGEDADMKKRISSLLIAAAILFSYDPDIGEK